MYNYTTWLKLNYSLNSNYFVKGRGHGAYRILSKRSPETKTRARGGASVFFLKCTEFPGLQTALRVF